MQYRADESRYDTMPYRYTGRSGLKLPALSLGMWHNFSKYDNYERMVEILTTAFDGGITHFDLANNYGRPFPGSAEENMGKILREELSGYRDELVISTKAGYTMWPGPYGDYGSRKYLISSIDASLKRLGLDYVDIFYHHRMDQNTPLEETMGALCDIVRSGKALYVGISNYDAKTAKQAEQILNSMGVHCLIHQFRYSMMDRHVETEGILQKTKDLGIGTIAFSPLEQGILTNRYLQGIPEDSRAAKPDTFLSREKITPELLSKVSALYEVAGERGQSLSQMAISWLLGVGGVTSVLIGASSGNQVRENLKGISCLDFTEKERRKIEDILSK